MEFAIALFRAALRRMAIGSSVLPAFLGLASGQPLPTFEVRVQAIIVSDDDGGRRARVNAEQIKRWIAFADKTYTAAMITLLYDPSRDTSFLKSTIINNMTGTGDSNWAHAKDLANHLAAKHPNRLVVFFRHGPGVRPTGGGFSWLDYDFVVMPGFEDASHCGHPHVDALAHEIGHFLGLPHTFKHEPFEDVAAAEAFFVARGNNPSVFDGDGFGDTPPDPSIRALECARQKEVLLQGTRFPLPRRNIMAYYDERDSLSAEQVERVRWFLGTRRERKMSTPRNTPTDEALEAEHLVIVSSERARGSVQNMTEFGVGNWSENVQLFCDARMGGSITLDLIVRDTNAYHAILYATRAPDFARIRVDIDEETVGAPVDLYAPVVLASGAIPLGVVKLRKGTHRIRFTVVGKRLASTHYRFGVDAVDFVPVN